MRVGYLGPAGSFSHVAAQQEFQKRAEFTPFERIVDVLRAVADSRMIYAVVPIENSVGGGIGETLDALITLKGQITICGERLVPIHHHLLGRAALERVDKIFSKRDVFNQCQSWLSRNLPNAKLIDTPSSSKAVQRVALALRKDRRARVAAIGSVLAGKLYEVPTLRSNIEDNKGNTTRFFIVGQSSQARTRNDKTAIIFTTKDQPGALVRVLACFDRAKVNLTHIDKRPTVARPFSYTFFIECEGHKNDPKVQRALRAAGRASEHVWLLGSYPAASLTSTKHK